VGDDGKPFLGQVRFHAHPCLFIRVLSHALLLSCSIIRSICTEARSRAIRWPPDMVPTSLSLCCARHITPTYRRRRHAKC
jgi:hypothetical protein